MNNQDWLWVRQDVVLAVHNDQIARHVGSEGLRDAGGLESVLAYAQNLAVYGGPGLAELAAGYFLAVAKNHAFVEGVAGGAIGYDGAREWIAARLT